MKGAFWLLALAVALLGGCVGYYGVTRSIERMIDEVDEPWLMD